MKPEDLLQFQTRPGPMFVKQWREIDSTLRQRLEARPVEEEALLLRGVVELLAALESFDLRPSSEKEAVIEVLHLLSENLTLILRGREPTGYAEEPALDDPLHSIITAAVGINRAVSSIARSREDTVLQFYDLPLTFCAALAWQLEKPPELRQPVIVRDAGR